MEYKLLIELPLKFSLNKYERTFWVKRNEIKKQFYWAVKTAQRDGYMPKPPFEVHYHFMLWGAKMDLSNLMGMVKPLEDGLVLNKLFEDDNPDIIRKITLTESRAPEASKRTKTSYCLITIKHSSEANI